MECLGHAVSWSAPDDCAMYAPHPARRCSDAYSRRCVHLISLLLSGQNASSQLRDCLQSEHDLWRRCSYYDIKGIGILMNTHDLCRRCPHDHHYSLRHRHNDILIRTPSSWHHNHSTIAFTPSPSRHHHHGNIITAPSPSI